MATRAMTASELTEFYTLAAAKMLSYMNRGLDSVILSGSEVTPLVQQAIWRSKIRLTNPATLNVDETTGIPDDATIALLSS